MRCMKHLYALLLLISLWVGCRRPSPEPIAQTPLTPFPLPTPGYWPQHIRDYIEAHADESLTPLWQVLQIPDESFGTISLSGRKDQLALFTFHTGTPRQLAVLRIANGAESYRYLFFQTGNGENLWEFVSYHDEPYIKYGLPGDPRIEFLGDRFWVVLPSRGWFGTGISAIYQEWFSLREKPAKQVLLESKHSQYSPPHDLVISETCRVMEKHAKPQGGEVVLECDFQWGSGQKPITAWQRKTRKAYRWNTTADTFEFVRNKSSAQPDFTEKFYLKGDVGFAESLSLCANELLRVARFGNMSERVWLKEHLQARKESSSLKRKLLEALLR